MRGNDTPDEYLSAEDRDSLQASDALGDSTSSVFEA